MSVLSRVEFMVAGSEERGDGSALVGENHRRRHARDVPF